MLAVVDLQTVFPCRTQNPRGQRIPKILKQLQVVVIVRFSRGGELDSVLLASFLSAGLSNMSFEYSGLVSERG